MMVLGADHYPVSYVSQRKRRWRADSRTVR